MQERVNQTILGPGGQPLAKPVVEDRTVTYAKDGESYSIDPEQLLIRAARMLRDGWSLERIRSELDLIKDGPQGISLKTLEAAIRNVGMPALELAIAQGREPAESQNVVAYEVLDPEGEALLDPEGEKVVIDVVPHG
jgi:hypothetical protein